jgi:hypothetical protein
VLHIEHGRPVVESCRQRQGPTGPLLPAATLGRLLGGLLGTLRRYVPDSSAWSCLLEIVPVETTLLFSLMLFSTGARLPLLCTTRITHSLPPCLASPLGSTDDTALCSLSGVHGRVLVGGMR